MMEATTNAAIESVDEKSVLQLPEGMLGFSRLTRYVLVDDDRIRPLLWLQSLDDPNLAFPVVDPRAINPNYFQLLPTGELGRLRIRSRAELLMLVVAILRPAPEQSSVNLKAPVLINHTTMIGRQIILEEPRAEIRAIFPELPASADAASAG
jgi:flagellar assembly factor FliW